MVEPGQNRKIAALRSSMCVHFFYYCSYMRGVVVIDKYMNLAVEQAKIAFDNNDVPVGAVIVMGDRVLSSCFNRKNIDNVAVFHAEILCIIEASRKLGSWYLNDCDLYVTLKPCNMCMYAIAESRIKNVYYLMDSNYVDNLDKNFAKINFNSVEDKYKYSDMLTSFFKKLR